MPQSKPNILLITLASVFFVFILFVLHQLTDRSNSSLPIACPADAKLCPDGSAVGRTGPKCEFQPCSQTVGKTYDNQKNSYQFNYPSNMIIAGDQDRIDLITPTGNHIYLTIDSDSSPTIEQYLAKVDKISQTAWENSPSVKVKSTKKTVINGLNCIQRVEDDLSAGIEVTNTYFKSGTNIVISTYSAIPGNESTSDEQTYSQILSTFKFIGKTQTTTSSWKTYTNEIYNYSINYPSNFSYKTCEDCNPSQLEVSFSNNEQTINFVISYSAQSTLCANNPSPCIPTKDLQTVIIGKTYIPEQYYIDYYKNYIFKIEDIFLNGKPSQIGIQGSYKAKADSMLINQILSTFKFTP